MVRAVRRRQPVRPAQPRLAWKDSCVACAAGPPGLIGSRGYSGMGAVARQHALGAEMTGKHAAAPDLAGDLQPCLVQVQYVLDDGQAQAGTAGLARSAGRDPVEAF